jgi:hypothetical protein
MWGRTSNDDILRLGYSLTTRETNEIQGFMIRTAVTLTDPCMINDAGFLLTDPRAYPSTISFHGVTQTPAEQAGQIILQIRNVLDVADGGLQPNSMLLAMPWDETPEPVIDANAQPAVRKTACQAYWGLSPYAYTPAPLTLTAPAHGLAMGPIAYSTSVPLNSVDSIPLVSHYDLSNLQEFWMTLESVPPAMVDPAHRGPPYLQGYRVNRGDGTANFDLTGSDPGVTGSLVLILPTSGY